MQGALIVPPPLSPPPPNFGEPVSPDSHDDSDGPDGPDDLDDPAYDGSVYDFMREGPDGIEDSNQPDLFSTVDKYWGPLWNHSRDLRGLHNA